MHSQGWDMHPSHLSGGQNQAPPTVTSGSMSQYSQYQPPLLQPGPASYSSAGPYPQYGYSNPTASPQSAGHPGSGSVAASQMNPHLLPLPTMSNSQPPQGAPQMNGGHQYAAPGHVMDTTGQVAPAGTKPRVTATLWEDEDSLCFQVEAKGVCVARREDNHFINGTKLLNVAGMTRGRRDGILKSEKIRNVVKIGPMHLKGVWIPFERALEFANKEKITESLYPLFVHNIGALLYHPTNQSRPPNSLMPNQAPRGRDSNPQMRTPQSSGPPSSLTHHHMLQNSQPGPGLNSGANGARPSLDRAHTFPTPPTSASSLMGMSSSDQSFQWGGQPLNGVPGQNLSIDTGLSKALSQPTTPATTPPGSMVQSMQPYPNAQPYDHSRQLYSAAPAPQSQYAPQSGGPQSMARYGAPLPSNQYMKNEIASNHYIKNEMGPPAARVPGSDADQHGDSKDHLLSHGQPNGHVSHPSTEEQEHDHDAEYSHNDPASYNQNRGSAYYGAGAPVEPLGSDHTHLSPDLAGSPHHSASGRATPRTGAASSQSWGAVAPTGGYNTPPRAAPPASNAYNVLGGSDQRAPAANGAANAGSYSGQNGLGAYATGAATVVNGSSNKRLRDLDDDGDRSRPSSRSAADGMDLKRRKTFQTNSLPELPSPGYDHHVMHRAATTIAQPQR